VCTQPSSSLAVSRKLNPHLFSASLRRVTDRQSFLEPPKLARTPANRVVEELEQTSHKLEQLVGKSYSISGRPMARVAFVLRTARDLGMMPVTWNAMTNDWVEPSADRIAEQLKAKIETNSRRAGEHIVLHDGGHRGLGAKSRTIRYCCRPIAGSLQNHPQFRHSRRVGFCAPVN